MGKMNLKQAQAVIAAHRRAEEQARTAEHRKLIGRFFKYRNCYSCPQTEADRWWLYATVTGVSEEYGWAEGWQFQRTSQNEIKIELEQRMNTIPDGAWVEISADEFWREACKMAAAVSAHVFSRAPTSGSQQ